MMKTQIRQEYKALAAIVAMIAVVASVWFLFPRAEGFGAISSREVDRILYKHLDEYKRTYSDDPQLARIFSTAINNPDLLSPADREIYLAREREFFGGWEVAWIYRDAGYFDNDRYKLWDTWYIEEARRRPKFAWTENQEHFSLAFAQHVSQSLDIE